MERGSQTDGLSSMTQLHDSRLVITSRKQHTVEVECHMAIFALVALLQSHVQNIWGSYLPVLNKLSQALGLGAVRRWILIPCLVVVGAKKSAGQP